MSVYGPNADLYRARLEALIAPYYPKFLLVFACVYAGFACLHLGLAQPAVALVLVPLAVLTSLSGFALYWLLKRGSLPGALKSRIMCFCAAGLIMNSSVHIFAEQSMAHSTNLAVALVASGLFLFTWKEFAAAAGFALGVFLMAAGTIESPQTAHFAFHMAEMLICAALAFWIKTEILGRMFHASSQAAAALGRAEALSRERQAHLEAALAADAAKTRFLATMSHELRTPLNAVIGFGHFLQDPDFVRDHPDKAAGYAGDIARSGQYLLDVISDILDYAKIADGKMVLNRETVRLAWVAERAISVVRPLAERDGLALSLEAGPDPAIHGDPQKLVQALVNLLSNAVKFTEAGSVRVVIGADGGDALIRVTDTGIGISKADCARIFSPFVQADGSLARKHDGTGLGLALVKAIAVSHGGSVSVDSTLGKGATFTLRLPVLNALAQAA